MTPEQKAELRRQCEADGRLWVFSKNPNLDNESDSEYVVLMMDDQIQAHVEALYAERLRVQPLIEAGKAQKNFILDLQQKGTWATTSLYEKRSNNIMDAFNAALTAYQNTER